MNTTSGTETTPSKSDTESQQNQAKEDKLERARKQFENKWWNMTFAGGFVAIFNISILAPLSDSFILKLIAIISSVIVLLGSIIAQGFQLLYGRQVIRFHQQATVDEDGKVHLASCLPYWVPWVFVICGGEVSVALLGALVYHRVHGSG
ncbi:hypothetical protein VNI00_009521 [Paramarasmius palmivorus]|uniref:Uncharacterized protein n=1 Tax=Paramarasmius palmivorus TaxID=297713 RepID=A0AAW0CSC0_9AGAR